MSSKSRKRKLLLIGAGTAFVIFLIMGSVAFGVFIANSKKDQSFAIDNTSPQTPAEPQKKPLETKELVDTDVIQALNSERAKVGSPAVSYNALLVSAASEKAKNSIDTNDYTPGSGDAINTFPTKVGYSSAGMGLFIYPVRTPMTGADFVNMALQNASNKQILMDGKYKDVGVALVPVNKNGISNVVTLYIGAPYQQQAQSTPTTRYVPTYTAPRSIHCSSYELLGSIQTNCY